MPTKWNYEIQIKTFDARMYRRRGGDDYRREGMSWSLDRTCTTESGEEYRQSVVVSPEVFESQDEALKDALEKLSMLRCPLDQPLDRAIKDLLGG